MSHLRNDIALLQLDRRAQLSDKVNTVCLPSKGSRVAAGTECYITGRFRNRFQFMLLLLLLLLFCFDFFLK